MCVWLYKVQKASCQGIQLSLDDFELKERGEMMSLWSECVHKRMTQRRRGSLKEIFKKRGSRMYRSMKQHGYLAQKHEDDVA